MTTRHEERATPPADPVPGWNDTATPYERDTTIDRVVTQRAHERPDAVALDGPGGSMTYEELDRRSDAVARSVAPFVAEADACIGVMSGRCAEAVVAFLGVMKAGAAYVPLELDQPASRLSFMVADTRARVVLAPAHLAHAAQALGDVTVLAIAPAVDAALAQRQYGVSLSLLATLRSAIDSFFDRVMVMDQDQILRHNRLALLRAVQAAFGAVADLSRLPG